jgi:formylglycine-generating enzyme required for sulfatase activity
MGSSNPSYFAPTGGGKDKVKGQQTDRFPVENVSWEDAETFCRELSKKADERAASRVYRLPTEAEWEYACRGGASSALPFHVGKPNKSLSSKEANFNGDYPGGHGAVEPSHGRTTTVASYKANAFGLHDMHGNVWEWCSDWYSSDYYKNGDPKDPKGPPKSENRVLRGGAWDSPGKECRAAQRYSHTPNHTGYNIGFRVICEVPLR